MPEGNLLYGAIGGLAGTVVITILMFSIRAGGRKLDLPYLLGTRFTDIQNRSRVYTIGFVMHFAAGAAWGAMYVLTLTAMGVNPDWPAGILWGFAHGIFIGVVMSTMGEQHPYIGDGKPIEEPGILGSNWSPAMPYLVLGLHIIYGVVTLLTYQLLFNPTISS